MPVGKYSPGQGLDLRGSGYIRHKASFSKNANYAVANTDSGKYIIASNSAQDIYFTLPAVATANGDVFTFFNANSAAMLVRSPDATNSILTAQSVNATDRFHTVNTSGAVNFGTVAEFVSDGSTYYLTKALGAANSSVFIGTSTI